MRLRTYATLMVVALVAAVVLVGTTEATAQQTQSETIIDRQFRGEVGAKGPYFRPTDRPYQSSFTRRWQEKLNEVWGHVPAGRNVPRPQDPRFWLPPPRDTIFVHPPGYGPRPDCDSPASCHRLWRRQQRKWGVGWGWRGWYR